MNQESEFTEDERAMVEFALRWVNHGGGPDPEIRERFDLTSSEYFQRLAELLDRNPDRVYRAFGLSPVMMARMQAVARRRIWVSS